MAFDRLRSWFRATWPRAQAFGAGRSAIGRALPLTIPYEVEREINQAMVQQEGKRRFQRPDRLHPIDFAGAMQPHSINDDLAMDLPRLMAECAHRFATNPIFEGVCNTYTQDVVGPEGPTLQIISDNERFNETVEDAWRAVFADPSPDGRLRGPEMMKMWVRQLLLSGAYLNIQRNVPRGLDMPTFGWSCIHARRLQTPMEFATDEDVAFGIRIDPKTGRPKTYYIDRPRRFGSGEMSLGEYQQFPAEMVQHKYFAVEPEQLTGYPLMSSTLRTVDELIELDDATIDAAQSAAHHSWWLQAASPEKVLDPEPITGTTYPVTRGAANVAPPGWTANGLQATQPNQNATDYRNLRLAEVGRPINMPLLIVLLSVNEATFSSAQFAGALYRDGVMGIQRYLARESLNSFIDMVVLDLVLSGQVTRPRKWEKVWTHNVPPYANIEKFVAFLETAVSNGFITQAEASAMLGYDWEKVVAGRKRCAADLEKAGLPPAPVNAGNPPKEEKSEDGESKPPAKKPAAKPPGRRTRRVVGSR